MPNSCPPVYVTDHGVWCRRNPACNNLCSKCFRDISSKAASEKQQLATASKVEVAPAAPQLAALREATPAPEEQQRPLEAPPAASPAEQSSPACMPAQAQDGEDDRPLQKNTNRCFECNKKVGLTGFKCRCCYVYCALHRHADGHNCTFNYKQMDRDLLAKNNPVVQADRVTRF